MVRILCCRTRITVLTFVQFQKNSRPRPPLPENLLWRNNSNTHGTNDVDRVSWRNLDAPLPGKIATGYVRERKSVIYNVDARSLRIVLVFCVCVRWIVGSYVRTLHGLDQFLL